MLLVHAAAGDDGMPLMLFGPLVATQATDAFWATQTAGTVQATYLLALIGPLVQLIALKPLVVPRLLAHYCHT